MFLEISVAHFWAQFGKIVAHFNPIILVTLVGDIHAYVDALEDDFEENFYLFIT